MHGHFDRKALKGIYYALPCADKAAIALACYNRNVRLNAQRNVCDDDLHIVQEIMVDLGHIVPFDVPPCGQAAEEYDEIMAAQELVSGQTNWVARSGQTHGFARS